MNFSLPGQFRGPECKCVIPSAVALRKKLEPWFADIDGGNFKELIIVLRVDGSLGSFGPEGVENVKAKDGMIECDLIIPEQDWKEITAILRSQVLKAINTCFTTIGVSYEKDTLIAAVS